ncbi:hypothetical protein LZ30DRAFT_743313 [Colletotrichum cereale]|nr:hypothetical protein LZ30DRAFT_743313 [Colletotrichum cereale]
MLISKATALAAMLFAADAFAAKVLLAAFYHDGKNVDQAERYIEMSASKAKNVGVLAVEQGHGKFYVTIHPKLGPKIGTEKIYDSYEQASAQLDGIESFVRGLVA